MYYNLSKTLFCKSGQLSLWECELTIEVIEAETHDSRAVSQCVTKLLLELEPNASDEIKEMGLPEITHDLLRLSKIAALVAKTEGDIVGVLTLHECAAIYAGGVFGEISELYVEPEFRSKGVGKQLLNAAHCKAKELGWTRLEVGTPPVEGGQNTLRFYEKNGYAGTGVRLRRLLA